MNARGPLLRRLGGGAVTAAVLTLGVAGGLVLGAPASAADSGDIQVKMAGDTGFSSVAASPLLSIADLAPGGMVSGTMQIRDTSDTDGTHGTTDTLSLQMINVATTDDCDVAASCAGSGDALAQALSFTVDVTAAPPRPVRNHSVATVASLRSGVALATKRRSGDTVTLTVAASLPKEIGNAVAYGKLAFDLEMVLTPVPPGNSVGTGNGRGSGPGGGGQPGSWLANNAGANDNSPGVVEVLGTSRVQAAPPSGAHAALGSTLVLGQRDGSLSYTGFPLYVTLAVGGAVLLTGVALLLAARPRSRRPADPAEH